jgi:hypothetical protein
MATATFAEMENLQHSILCILKSQSYISEIRLKRGRRVVRSENSVSEEKHYECKEWQSANHSPKPY